MMSTPSYLSDPHVQYLSQLIEDLETGLLQIPLFQRPLIWDVDQRLELLRSVRDGIPFGSILIWRTKNSEVRCYESMGPHRLPSPTEGELRHYILDGVQRLSVLYSALHVPEGEGDEDDYSIIEFHYDLSQEEFLANISTDLRQEMLPLNILLDSVALLKFQRSLKGDMADIWIARADQLAKAFGRYKVPVIPISTEDLDLATRTFQRINTQGTKMSDLHMVHALTFSKTFVLQEKIEDLRQETFAPLGWADIEPDWILQACKAALGLDIYGTDAQKLGEELRNKPEILETVGESMERAVCFLRDRCCVPSPSLVPYAYQAILFAEAFRIQPDLDPELQELLRTWFWLTSFGEAFAGISGYRLGLVVEDVRMMLNDGNPRWSFSRPFQYRTLPARSTLRSVRLKALALWLGIQQNESGSQALAEYGGGALGHVLPRLESGSLFSNTGNRLVADPRELSALRAKLSDPDAAPVLLEQHIISKETHLHLVAGECALFVETRYKDLAAFESDLVEDLRNDFRIDA